MNTIEMKSINNFKFQLFSDIHLEHMKNSYPQITPLADYLFLGGDIGKFGFPNFKPFFDYCSKNWKMTFYIFGNHEFYHNSKTLINLKQEYGEFFDQYSNVKLLDDSYHDLELETITYRIYGSVLWSNIDLGILGFNDLKFIKTKNEKNWNVPISIDEFNSMNLVCVKKLINQVKSANQSNVKLIVMTHFTPTFQTIHQPNRVAHPMYDSQNISIKKYFSNDIINDDYLASYGLTTEEFLSNIKLWISGHTHYSYDFNFKGTRFLANQKGYDGEEDYTNFNYSGVFELN